MTEGVIDAFEAVQVDKHDGQFRAVPLCLGDGYLQPVDEHIAVGKSGKRIPVGKVLQLFFSQFAPPDLLPEGGGLLFEAFGVQLDLGMDAGILERKADLLDHHGGKIDIGLLKMFPVLLLGQVEHGNQPVAGTYGQ